MIIEREIERDKERQRLPGKQLHASDGQTEKEIGQEHPTSACEPCPPSHGHPERERERKEGWVHGGRLSGLSVNNAPPSLPEGGWVAV
mmetsp:Transcript_50859/g.100003  ORF Transcript_50859/g.100003 Transcript_50859/m.100003 type:complete len:88 (+) Transcript_50859:517-780(+)